MFHDLLMPKLGLTMKEGVIAEWMKSPGQAFAQGDVLVVVETEKIAYEIEAESPGVLHEIVVGNGGLAPVGSVIARWKTNEAAGKGSGKASSAAVKTGAPAPERRPTEPVPGASTIPARAGTDTGSRIRSTPLAQRYAREHGIELTGVRGTGPSGRIKLADVEAAADRPKRIRTAEAPKAAPAADPGSHVPANRVQAAIARRLTSVKQEVPHFYLAAEAEVSSTLALRKSLKSTKGYPHVTINHVVIAAVGRALLDLPQANRIWIDGQYAVYSSTDVGIAVHTPGGLFVPILRDAGRASLDAVARESAQLVEKARAGNLEALDNIGGAISVSNAGMYNVTYLTPIINPGHSSILGIGSVRQVFRPDANGQPSLRNEMGLVLACDHRVFDGVSGLEFLNCVIAYLEDPLRLLVNTVPLK
jgi:pyruvate dehydrogenase E2 component (dihydrolipoamide acetyltransferase)